MFQENISGTTVQRPVLIELLATLRTGDPVTVALLNRLGRNSAYIMQLEAELLERQVRFVALDLGTDTATPHRRGRRTQKNRGRMAARRSIRHKRTRPATPRRLLAGGHSAVAQ